MKKTKSSSFFAITLVASIFTIGCQVDTVSTAPELEHRPEVMAQTKGFPDIKSDIKNGTLKAGKGQYRLAPKPLSAEWNSLIDESLETLKENPLSLGQMRLLGLGGRWKDKYKDGKTPGTWTASSEIFNRVMSGSCGCVFTGNGPIFVRSNVEGMIYNPPTGTEIEVAQAFMERLGNSKTSNVSWKVQSPAVQKLATVLYEMGKASPKLAPKAAQIMLSLYDFNGTLSLAGVQARLKKRPDLLTSEWDQLIDDSITLLKENPLSLSKVNPLAQDKGINFNVDLGELEDIDAF